METRLGVRHLTRRGDYIFSFDLHDGFYALAIAPEFRDYFTVKLRNHLYRLAGLPMGWSLSPIHFRSPPSDGGTIEPPPPSQQTRQNLMRKRWKGVRVLPYVDDFLFFSSSEQQALQVRARLDKFMDRLGLLRHPIKGLWEFA
jgi:hypothetical protein